VSSPRDSATLVVVAAELPDRSPERFGAGVRLLEVAGATTAELLRQVAGAVAIVVAPSVTVDRRLLDAAGPELRLIANFGVGHDHIDLEACRGRGVMVTITPGVLTDATAELALALTLGAARRIGPAETSLRAGRWRGAQPDLGVELSGLCWGILGMGRIGTRYAELVRPMAGDILYAGRSPAIAAEDALGVVRVDLRELLSRADVVSLHLPAGAETDGLIGSAELRQMKPEAILVNTARGSLVDEEALAAALAAGEIGAAGLDVFLHEPEVPQSLLDAPRCVLLPHVGSATVRARTRMADLVAENVRSAVAGFEPSDRVA
jgi:glyoxylate reductase